MKPLQIETGFGSTAKTVTGTDQGHAAFENAVGQNWKLIRLAAGEIGQFFLCCNFFLIDSGRLRCNKFCLGMLLRLLLLNHLLRVGGRNQTTG